jgi:predicted nucleotidyltransferase
MTTLDQESRQREREIKDMLRESLRQASDRLRGHRVFLFGSRAAGTARPRSDFDVGVDGDGPLPLRDFYAIEALFDALPTLYRIDWVDLQRVSPEFRARATERIEILYDQ